MPVPPLQPPRAKIPRHVAAERHPVQDVQQLAGEAGARGHAGQPREPLDRQPGQAGFGAVGEELLVLDVQPVGAVRGLAQLPGQVEATAQAGALLAHGDVGVRHPPAHRGADALQRVANDHLVQRHPGDLQLGGRGHPKALVGGREHPQQHAPAAFQRAGPGALAGAFVRLGQNLDHRAAWGPQQAHPLGEFQCGPPRQPGGQGHRVQVVPGVQQRRLHRFKDLRRQRGDVGPGPRRPLAAHEQVVFADLEVQSP